MNKEYLRAVIERGDTRAGRLFDYVVQSLIVVSLIGYAWETMPGVDGWVAVALQFVEISCVLLFTAEYALRVFVSTNRRAYIFSFYGIIDLLAFAPFYLALGFDSRVIRAFRLMRLFRVLKLARFNKAFLRFALALRLAREEIVLFMVFASIVIYLAGAGIYYFEGPVQPEVFRSMFDSLWWAIVSLTTVGYGDLYPITVGGKIFTSILLLVGLGLVAVPAGILASSLEEAREIASRDSDKRD